MCVPEEGAGTAKNVSAFELGSVFEVILAKRISEAFKGVTSFSTRDQNTHDFVASLTDADIEDNLDPVLIYNFDDELEDVEMPRVPEHYCVIYSYYNRIHTQVFEFNN